MSLKKPTASDIRIYREINQCGIIEARHQLNKNAAKEMLKEITNAVAIGGKTTNECIYSLIDIIEFLLYEKK